MAYDYEKAFALTDDPFKPKQPLDGITNAPAQDSLEVRPLLINAESALTWLYCPEAGRFAHYEEKFQDYARSEGYRDDTDPPRAGANSSLLSLYGHEGTGKTTLAQAMINWLKQCKPKVGQWHIEDKWSSKIFDTPAEQIAALDELQAKVSKGNSKYNCVVLDNLLPGRLKQSTQSV